MVFQKFGISIEVFHEAGFLAAFLHECGLEQVCGFKNGLPELFLVDWAVEEETQNGGWVSCEGVIKVWFDGGSCEFIFHSCDAIM